jgi:hypothetical protein
MAMVDLASVGFAFHADWYWRIVENAGTFGAAAARACLVPLAKLADGRFVLDGIAITDDDRAIALRLNGAPITIAVGIEQARNAADRFVIELNVHLCAVDHAFALVVPRRYQLRGVLLPRAVLADHARDRYVIAPSDRTTWRRYARGTHP